MRLAFTAVALVGVGLAARFSLASEDIGAPLVPLDELEGNALRREPSELTPLEGESSGELVAEEAEAASGVVLEGGYLPDEIEEQYEWLEFSFLTSFEYPDLVELDAEEAPPELPADVAELDGLMIAIEGFMNPLAFDREGVSQFALVNDPLNCCFGNTPNMNHWIDVTLPEGERTAFYSLDPVAVYGRLEVGEAYEDGFVVSLFRMRADHVIGDF